jgi:hypothetical protein
MIFIISPITDDLSELESLIGNYTVVTVDLIVYRVRRVGVSILLSEVVQNIFKTTPVTF